MKLNEGYIHLGMKFLTWKGGVKGWKNFFHAQKSETHNQFICWVCKH